MLAIQREIAATSSAPAHIQRIKAHPPLTASEIRVQEYDSDYARVSPTHVKEAGDLAAATAATPVGTHAVPPAVAPLDQRGTRRAPRFKIVAGVEVRIDGNAASLVNLSTIGAQVVSPVILKPNQHVRFTFVDPPRHTRCRAAIAWASFEIPKGVALYRAGLELFDANQAALTRFIEAHKAK